MEKLGNIKQSSFSQIYSYARIFRYIQAYSDISRHYQAYSGIFRNYWGIFSTLCNPSIFRILAYSKAEAYSEPWYTRNSSTFRTRDICRILSYSEHWVIQNCKDAQDLVKHLQLSTLRNSLRLIFMQYYLFMPSSSSNKCDFLTQV